MDKSTWKKIVAFFGLCFYAVGSIGGIGYACFCRAWVVAACVAVLAVIAFPKAKEFFSTLTS